MFEMDLSNEFPIAAQDARIAEAYNSSGVTVSVMAKQKAFAQEVANTIVDAAELGAAPGAQAIMIDRVQQAGRQGIALSCHVRF